MPLQLALYISVNSAYYLTGPGLESELFSLSDFFSPDFLEKHIVLTSQDGQ
jgi:hypothetical protein